jgi:hypothetical protein
MNLPSDLSARKVELGGKRSSFFRKPNGDGIGFRLPAPHPPPEIAEEREQPEHPCQEQPLHQSTLTKTVATLRQAVRIIRTTAILRFRIA